MQHKKNQKRRQFISEMGGIAALSMINPLPGFSFTNNRFTVGQVIDIILKEIEGAPFERTVDQLRSGDLDQVVTGIVTTMFPTIEVIKETAKIGANFIIAHETPFYNNNDETDWLQEDDAYMYKIELLKAHKIAIWRFHDYWHRHKPDGIIMGNLLKLGWEKQYDVDSPRLITLAKAQSLESIAVLVKERLGISTLRIVGDLNQSCQRIYLAFGYFDSKTQIGLIQKYKPDLILSGETREWETVERVRDGRQMGQKTALMILSHAVSEEAGMEYAAKWLSPKLPSLKITHIPSGNPFTFF